MTADEKLFHLMAEKMEELATELPVKEFNPDDDDVALVLGAVSVLIDRMNRNKYTKTAAAAVGIASGELCDDMGYHFNERYDNITYLLNCLVESDDLEELRGDNDTAYIRI